MRAPTAVCIGSDPSAVRMTSRSPGPTPWADEAGGGTRMTLRNRGGPAGVSKVVGQVMAAAMRQANRKDLRRLKELLESDGL